MLAVLGLNPSLIGQRSRHRISDFELHRPESVREAATLLPQLPGPAIVMAGGVDVVNRMKSGMRIAHLLHLARVPELRRIWIEDGDLFIGATATHADVAASEHVRRTLPSFSSAWRSLANMRVRHHGTIGGNLMAGEPSYDFAMVAGALGAELHFALETRRESCAVEDASAFAGRGLLVHIRIPKPASQVLFIEREWKPELAFALSLFRREDGSVGIRLATGAGYSGASAVSVDVACGPGSVAPDRPAIVRALMGQLPDPVDDFVASSSYRKRLLEVLLTRSLATTAPDV